MEQPHPHLLTTALHSHHVALGAKMVDFGGWDMPLQYSGILEEHRTVRNHVGLFDVSHMGRILISGPQAGEFLDFLSTNHIKSKKDQTAIYTVFCNPQGGSVDDLIIYKMDPEHFFLVANASNRQKDLQHLLEYASSFDVMINDQFFSHGILALQGPQAVNLLQELIPGVNTLKPMTFGSFSYQQKEVIVAATGYTGAGGFEIFGENDLTQQIWDDLLRQGVEYQIKPIGLGARDTLRLEMGYALYGHELSDEISPAESVSSWTVKWDKEFLGKKSLQEIISSPIKRRQYGFLIPGQGIARQGFEVFKNEKLIGSITSGGFSPTLNKAIGIMMVNEELQPVEDVFIKIRQQLTPAKVTALPFIKRT